MLEQNIHNLIEPPLAEQGYELVQIKIMGAPKQGKTLQIMVENVDGTGLSVGNLQQISRIIAKIMDEEDPISDKYYLEVSSPGIDRPLVKKKDFENHIGFLISVKLISANDKGRKFKGVVKTVNEDKLIFQPENFPEEFEIDFLNIDSAKLVLTDELIKSKQVKEAKQE